MVMTSTPPCLNTPAMSFFSPVEMSSTRTPRCSSYRFDRSAQNPVNDIPPMTTTRTLGPVVGARLNAWTKGCVSGGLWRTVVGDCASPIECKYRAVISQHVSSPPAAMHTATMMIFLAARLKTASGDRKLGHCEMYAGDCDSLVA